MASATIEIAGTTYNVERLSGEARISTLFRFDLSVSGLTETPAAGDLLGQTCTLTISDKLGATLPVHGLVTSVERSIDAFERGALQITVGPMVEALTVGRDLRVFQEMDLQEIIQKVLEKAGIDAGQVRWSLTQSYRKRHYCAQHRESNFAFISRLLAEEGVHYWFDLQDGQTIFVMADDSTLADPISGDAQIPFVDDDELSATRDAVVRVGSASRVVTDAVTLRDYSHERPKVLLEGKAGSGKREVYDYPGRFDMTGDGARLAKVAVEAFGARKKVVFGEASSLRMVPGMSFEMTSHPVGSLNRKYLIESLTLDVGEGESATSGKVAVRWTATPLDVPYRAPRDEVVAHPGGPQTGAVVGAPGEEIHPDSTGRIRVQHYWDREGAKDDKASTWMRVGQLPLGGSMILPRVGWDVLVHHHEGDIDAPFVCSHLYDGQYVVPYPLPENKTRTAWQTATTPGGGSSNEMRFEDKAGSEEMFLNASKDMNVVVGDSKSEKVGVDQTIDIGSNYDVSVGSNYSLGVKTDQKVSIGGSESLTVSGARKVSITGSESASVGGSRSVTAISGVDTKAAAGHSLTVGGSLTAVSALGVNRMAIGSMSVTVGGSWIQAAATGLAAMTGGAAAETIGGAKINVGAAGCSMSVKGAAAETVGGAYVIATGSKASESATGSMAITVGGAFVANAPSISVEADSEVSIRCGGSSITITSGCIEVKAPLINTAAATVKKKTGKIERN